MKIFGGVSPLVFVGKGWDMVGVKSANRGGEVNFTWGAPDGGVGPPQMFWGGGIGERGPSGGGETPFVPPQGVEGQGGQIVRI